MEKPKKCVKSGLKKAWNLFLLLTLSILLSRGKFDNKARTESKSKTGSHVCFYERKASLNGLSQKKPFFEYN